MENPDEFVPRSRTRTPSKRSGPVPPSLDRRSPHHARASSSPRSDVASLPLVADSERQHYNVTLAILTIAGTAYALQQTMVIPALPALQRDLHTTTTWVTWVLTALLLVASVSTPILGKLGDQYGKELLLVISLALFFVGCVGAAAAWNIWTLIFFRAFQGLGAAVFPLSFGIIRDEFPRERSAWGSA